MRITSPAFDDGGVIPAVHSREGGNVSPELTFLDVPPEAKSLALIMDDPDVPPQAGVPVWDHWVVFNIPPRVGGSAQGTQPPGTAGKGTRGGPKPPDREHRYFFKLYALDTLLQLAEGATKREVEEAMTGHIVAYAELMGRFSPQHA